MARSRNIKPGFFTNELLAELPAFDRLLFVGLWCLADREGRLEDRPKRIKMELFPCDSYDVSEGIESLCAAGFVERYQVDEFSVIEIVNFTKHQSPHGSEKDSALPDRNGYLTVNERRKNVVVPYKSTKVHIKESLPNVKPPLDVVEPNVSERPDSPIPDSPIPDSPIPDSEFKSISAQQAETPKKEKARRSTKIPDPFLLTAEMRAWAIEHAPALNIREETENFVDYWRGAGKPKADWIATWRTWMRKNQKDAVRGTGYKPINRQQQIEDANQAVVLEIAERERLRRLAEQGKMPQQDDFISTGDIIIEGEYIHAK